MKLKKYTIPLQIIVVLLSLILLYVLFKVVPETGVEIVDNDPNYFKSFYIWLGVIWLETLPIVVCGLITMEIFKNIGNNKIFTKENIKLIDIILKIIVTIIIFVISFNILTLSFLDNHIGLILIHLGYIFVLTILYLGIKLLKNIIENGAGLRESPIRV